MSMAICQPFVVLELRPAGPESYETWYVHVEGGIGNWLNGINEVLEGYDKVLETDVSRYTTLPPLEGVDFQADATEVMKEEIKKMGASGWEVLSIRVYRGTAERPTHVYRYGSFWRREKLERRVQIWAPIRAQQPTSADARLALGIGV